MNEIEYVFGTGDGTVHAWTSAADLELTGSGACDAVGLDFDGDGRLDDVLWDSHGTGLADVAGLDLDDDGVLDHFYTDPTGAGTWNHQITGSPADSGSEQLDWIVRTDAEPDHLAGSEIGTPSTEDPAPLTVSGWPDQQTPLDQLAALHDHRAGSTEAQPSQGVEPPPQPTATTS